MLLLKHLHQGHRPNEKFDEITTGWKISFWRNAVWVSSAYLWAAWLSHDVANIAVYLPRQLDITLLLIVVSYFTILLFYIFYIQGGAIQKVVETGIPTFVNSNNIPGATA